MRLVQERRNKRIERERLLNEKTVSMCLAHHFYILMCLLAPNCRTNNTNSKTCSRSGCIRWFKVGLKLIAFTLISIISFHFEEIIMRRIKLYQSCEAFSQELSTKKFSDDTEQLLQFRRLCVGNWVGWGGCGNFGRRHLWLNPVLLSKWVHTLFIVLASFVVSSVLKNILHLILMKYNILTSHVFPKQILLRSKTVRQEEKKAYGHVQKGPWKELYDPATDCFWYYNVRTQQNTWQCPLSLQKGLVCSWEGYQVFGGSSLQGRCRCVFATMEEYQGHLRRAHAWHCTACGQRNAGIVFPVCNLCENTKSGDGLDGEQVILTIC